MAHSTNYENTLICPAEDCKSVAKVPDKPGSVAAMLYELFHDKPYAMTSDDVLSLVAARRKEIPDDELELFRADFFSKGQPCFRASPLTKTHGWAVHSDAQGRIALIDPSSAQFAELAGNAEVSCVYAMRNMRA